MNTVAAEMEAGIEPQVEGRSLWQDAWKRLKQDRLAIISLYIFLCYVTVAFLTSVGLLAGDWGQEIGPSYSPPSFDNWRTYFGTDIFGRSVLLKAIRGAYVSISVGVFAALIAVPIGVGFGALAGYFGGWIDDIITWFYTTVSNIPSLILLVAIAFVLDKGLFSLCFALGMTSWV